MHIHLQVSPIYSNVPEIIQITDKQNLRLHDVWTERTYLNFRNQGSANQSLFYSVREGQEEKLNTNNAKQLIKPANSLLQSGRNLIL